MAKQELNLDELLGGFIADMTVSTPNRTDMSVIEFAEQILFNGNVELFPTQRAILKAFYGEPLDDIEIEILMEWRDLGRTNWVRGRTYKNLLLELGRGACPVATSEIITSVGKITYKELLDRHSLGETISIFTMGIDDYIYPTSKIKLWDAGLQPSYRLTLTSGKQEECTYNHPYLVIDKDIRTWVHMEHLEPGNVIAVVNNLSFNNTYHVLDWESIEYIEYIGQQPIIGIEVGDTHTIVNSIISHNSKSTLGSIIILKEFYDLITLEHPATHYGLIPNDPIGLFVMAQTLEQVKDTLFAKIKGYAEDSDFFKVLQARGIIDIYEQAIKCKSKNIAIFAKHTNSPALVGYTLKALIMDEFARFENKIELDGSITSMGDTLYRNVGASCLLDTTPLLTSKGFISAKDALDIYDRGESLELITMSRSYEVSITNHIDVWDNGIHEVIQFTTKSGKVESITEEHPLLVWRDDQLSPSWVEAKDVVIGDIVATSNNLPYFGMSTIGPDMARVLGYIYGDGGISDGISVNFTNVTRPVIEDFNKVLSDNFPGHILKRKSKDEDYKYTIINEVYNGKAHKNYFKRWVYSYCTPALSTTKRIPEVIRLGSKEEVCNFLAGFYSTDGYICFGKQRIDIGICLANKELIEDIQRELLRLGIYSVIRSKLYKIDRSNSKGRVDRYHWILEIRDVDSALSFIDNIPIVGKDDKVNELRDLLDKRINTISKSNKNFLPLGAKYMLRHIKTMIGKRFNNIGLTPSIMSSTNTSRLSLHNLKRVAEGLNDSTLLALSNAPIIWEPITSIKHLGTQSTIGIEMEDTGIIVNSIISHNTNRFGKKGYRIAISSAWEIGDPMERLVDSSQADPDTLTFKLRTWDVNKMPAVSREACNSDYIIDRAKAELEYEGIRRQRLSNFISEEILNPCLTGLSCIDSESSTIENSIILDDGTLETKYLVVNNILRMEPADEGESYVHVDFSVIRDATACASSRAISIEDEWYISVDLLLLWQPYRDKTGRKYHVSYQNVEDIILNLSQPRNIREVSFDSFNSESSIQKFHSSGIRTDKLSASRNDQLTYYTTFRDIATQGRLILPKDSINTTKLISELTNIIIKPNGSIVHGVHGKDLADAVVCSVYKAYINLVKSGRILGTKGLTVSAINSKSKTLTNKGRYRTDAINRMRSIYDIPINPSTNIHRGL